jgi:hypothetical protein
MNRVRRALVPAAPVAVTALFGAWWMAFHAEGGRGSAHTLWQRLALAETLLALLLRQRKPVGALAGILAAYLLFALGPPLLPGVLFALFTVAATGHHCTMVFAATATAAAFAAMPYLRGDSVSLLHYILPRLAAAAIAAAAGAWLHARHDSAGARARPRHGVGEPESRLTPTRPDHAGGSG